MTLPPPLYPLPTEEPLPTLTPEVVADDDDLGVAVDEFVRLNREARVRQWEIAMLQECLRDAVDAGAWRLVLVMEETMNARFADVVVEIARWSFAEGRRFPVASVSPDEQISDPQQGGA